MSAEQLADIAGHVGQASDPADGAARVVKHAVDLTAAHWAEVVEVSPHGRFRLLAATDAELSQAIFRSRQLSGTNPPLPDERPVGERIVIQDMAHDERWPNLTEVAHHLPVASAVLEYLVVDGQYSAGLAVYDDRSHYFSQELLVRTRLLARIAAPLLAGLAAAEQRAHLQAALESNRDIAAAVGVVMASRHVSRSAAVDLLVRTSQRSNRKLRDVAGDVLAKSSLSV